MDNPGYDQEPDYDYDEYDDDYYDEPVVTSVGLPAGQLALIIGVNAVLSLVISIVVVLIAGGSFDVQQAAGFGSETTDSPAVPQAGDNAVSVPQAPPANDIDQPQANTIESVDYTVESGDTLSLIADKFSVPLFDLMVANGLTDEDFIQAGQILVVPLGGVPTATPTFTAVPLPTETPLPFDPPTAIPTDARLPVEPAATVGPSPTPSPTPLPSPTPVPTSTPSPVEEVNIVVSEVTAPGDLSQETVVILNQGPGTSLKDWTLEGSALGIFQFPDVFLFSGGSIRIHTTTGENTASDLYLSQQQAAWKPGAVITLYNNRSQEASRYTIPAE